ncbi:M20/M25/M40 family metallo-hydrolase [Pseudochelatococcus sp. B33]
MITKAEHSVCTLLAQRQPEMLDLLEAIVALDSPSRSAAAVSAVTAHIRTFLEANGVETEILASPEYGDVVRAGVREAAAAPPVLLTGHCDTVFPLGEASRRPFRIDGTRAYGPGVADMKGGLVANAFVLAAIAALPAPRPPVRALLTVDEEIGSPFSRPIIEAEALAAACVFNAEPARPNGNVVVSRKGGLFMRCDVYGREAHSGVNYHDGVSAIAAIARKIADLYRIVDSERGITLNVGVIGGGRTVNTVCPHAFAEIDVRYVEPGDRGRLLAAVGKIVTDDPAPGIRGELRITGEFLPLRQSAENADLFALYRAAAGDVGFAVGGEASGGCADSGFAAATGTPTLCGTGPVGGAVHTADEYLELASLVPRAQALALAAMRAAMPQADGAGGA